MLQRMVFPAEPFDVERLGVIGMMALRFRNAADFAGLGDQASAGDRNLHADAGSLSCHGTPNSATRKSRPFRKRQSFSNWPSGFDAAHERQVSDAQFLGPRRERLRLAVKADQPVVSLIAALSFGISPAYVAGFVIAVIILSFKAETFWTGPHVSDESFERLEVRRYFNATSPVMRIGRVLGILASAEHVVPDPIISGSRLPMRTASIADIHGTMTAARDSVPRHEFFGPYGFSFRPAIAITEPTGSASCIRTPTGHGKFSESLADQIAKTWPRFARSFTRGGRKTHFMRAARLRIAVQKIRSSYCSFFAAFTTAEPVRLAVSSKCQPQYRQLAECLIAEIQDAATATRDRVPVFEIACTNQYFLSTLASAIPADSTASRIGPSLKHRKIAEHLARKIIRYPWHKPAVYANYRR